MTEGEGACLSPLKRQKMEETDASQKYGHTLHMACSAMSGPHLLLMTGLNAGEINSETYGWSGKCWCKKKWS